MNWVNRREPYGRALKRIPLLQTMLPLHGRGQTDHRSQGTITVTITIIDRGAVPPEIEIIVEVDLDPVQYNGEDDADLKTE